MAVDLPILSNRLFLEIQPETTWGDNGATTSAGDDLDLNAVVEPSNVANVVQPGPGPRLLKITITDANASIDAFQIDATGEDEDGNAVTQQFLFAGGLVQTGTAKFSAITTITLTSINGNAVGDSLAVSWVPVTELFPIKDGDYGVELEDPSREQEHTIGDPDAQFMVHSARRLGGPLKVGLWPHLWRSILDWGLERDADNEVASRVARLTYPDIETTEHLGLKCDRFTIEGASEGDIDATMELTGWYEKPRAGGIISYPGSYVIPEIPSLQFLNCYFIISLNSGGTGAFSNRIKPKGLQAFTLSYENNLRSGPPVEDRITLEKNAAIEFLVTGRKKLNLRYTAVFDRQEFQTLQRQRLYTQFKMMGAHPSYTSYGTVAAGPYAAGNNVVVTLGADPSAWLSVGDYVLFDNAGGANRACVGRVTAINGGGPTITIATLDEAVATGDHVFEAAIELKTAPAIVSSSPKSKAFGEFVTVEVNADVFSGQDSPLTYKARNLALPS